MFFWFFPSVIIWNGAGAPGLNTRKRRFARAKNDPQEGLCNVRTILLSFSGADSGIGQGCPAVLAPCKLQTANSAKTRKPNRGTHPAARTSIPPPCHHPPPLPPLFGRHAPSPRPAPPSSFLEWLCAVPSVCLDRFDWPGSGHKRAQSIKDRLGRWAKTLRCHHPDQLEVYGESGERLFDFRAEGVLAFKVVGDLLEPIDMELPWPVPRVHAAKNIGPDLLYESNIGTSTRNGDSEAIVEKASIGVKR